MKTTRETYQAPKLEVQRLHEQPSALAQSGCRPTPSKKCTMSNDAHKR